MNNASEIIKRNIYLVLQILFTIATIAFVALVLTGLISDYLLVIVFGILSLIFGFKYHKYNKILKSKGGK